MDDLYKFAELPISNEQAREIAKKILRTQIGSLPHLGEPQRDKNEWLFPILLKYPRVIFDHEEKLPIKLKFLSETQLGYLRVDGITGEAKYPKSSTIRGIIRERLDKIEKLVQQALVRAEAKKFSHLPYAELRYSPIVDLLSKLLIQDEIDLKKDLGNLDEADSQKYTIYINMLVKLGLVRQEGDVIKANDPLIGVDMQNIDLTEKLAVALELFFEFGYCEIDTIREILGPYLILSGYYYARVIESGDVQEVGYKQFERRIQEAYPGKEGIRKKLQLSRYLIQLQYVKLIKHTRFNGDSYWQGFEEVYHNLLKQEDILEPISELIA